MTLTFSLPGKPELGSPTLSLTRTAVGSWSGTGTVLSQFGRWDVSVLVQEATGGVTVPLQLTPRLPPEQIAVSRAPGAGQPDLSTITLPGGGGSLQAYVDPGSVGSDTVHFTFFRASGDEQAIASAAALALTPSGEVRDLPLIRLNPGHFGANTTLSAGRWTFLINATTPEGRELSGYFTDRIGP